MNILKAFNNNRLMKALTGLSKEEFYEILPMFEQILLEEINEKPRQRKPGGGQKGALKIRLVAQFLLRNKSNLYLPES